MSFSSRFMAGRRSRWASFRPQARTAPFITGSTTRHRQGRRGRPRAWAQLLGRLARVRREGGIGRPRFFGLRRCRRGSGEFRLCCFRGRSIRCGPTFPDAGSLPSARSFCDILLTLHSSPRLALHIGGSTSRIWTGAIWTIGRNRFKQLSGCGRHGPDDAISTRDRRQGVGEMGRTVNDDNDLHQRLERRRSQR